MRLGENRQLAAERALPGDAVKLLRAGGGTSLATLIAVPLAFIDAAVRRLPDPLTTAACAGTLALLAVAALTGHQPAHLGRGAIGAAALASFYLALPVIRPGSLGPGDAKLAGQRRRPRLAGSAGSHW